MTETITIPRAEYDALIQASEDLRDIQEAREVLRRVERGEEETLPSEFINRMIAGENLITLWREHRGLTKVELAKRAGIHRVNLSKIESGERGASVDTLKKLAVALSLTIDNLV